MPGSYAVTWEMTDGEKRSGGLELRGRAIVLGTNGDALEIPYGDLAAAYVERRPAARLLGHPTLVLERRSGEQLRIASLSQLGIVAELAERLAFLHLGDRLARKRVVVVLPIREGARGEVQELVDRGPPFDPEAAGLEQHQIFVTDHEVIFFFDAIDELAPQRIFGDQNVWAAASVWGDVVAGPARIGEEAYAWARSHAA